MSNRTVAIGDTGWWISDAQIQEMAILLNEGAQCLATDGRLMLGAAAYEGRLWAFLGQKSQADRSRRLGLSWASEGARQMAEALRAEMADAMETE